MHQIPSQPWWNRDFHYRRRPFLLKRNMIQSSLREYFVENQFIEIDSMSLQYSPGNETHIRAFSTELIIQDHIRKPLYLQTSPEFSCKKLLAAGEEKIFCFAHAWRNGEQGCLHQPEFTMLEWYRAHESYEQLMKDCMNIIRCAAEVANQKIFSFQNVNCNPFSEPEYITVAEAFARYANIDLGTTLDNPDQPDRHLLYLQAQQAGIRVAHDDTWSDIFSRILIEKIEPNLGINCCTILDRYPAPESALANIYPADPRFTKRFELYACNIELCNACDELLDPIEQRHRFEKEMQEKKKIYNETYPIDEDFLACLTEMPQSSGIAMGFDRLVMLVTGANNINEVIWTPFSQSNQEEI
ncbi:EF-P lysine aminoacylase EpmA [Candidatus Liberibacter asiaticus]|uniref:Lysyl-tRNA synthetase protein n=2 Tax=Liberibacter asiaticus TaxID=34021 RepID=A0ABM5NGV2_LIBAS|nr:EF-P lysine aminoacylase EpmA [Candidatus Liberibacter asiaticus]ACT57539.1 putative lysyl-tRNA synthetase protein [Candidatus Liberibacter asiaticus str. psy62]AGH17302.1 putative lysyl-tRNA synthetase protein [Candidatus Liberibacter asiaticus str. gxpsy]ALK07590.1 EF-P lysine aminoacylase GenX [Candidatus Liberibacter asiaticus]ASK53081.1 EF-P lysine aminoacylase GenX [Candidatus Liberibacter asiaticus]AWL14405.1 EF-P lysine aminoacylase GenX [Candidatus Liberibacter asiaticus]